MKILIVFGTRPEAIKMAPVVKEFKKYPGIFETVVCVSGQHRQLLDQVLEIFGIVPDFDLNIMKTGQDLFGITSKTLSGIHEILVHTNPELVFVHGDTTTSLATALATFYMQIPVAHVEAGLRSHNMNSPWPEELNRSLTGRIATWHFAPTISAKNNLLAENISENRIVVTGNTVIDAINWAKKEIFSNECKEVALTEFLNNQGYDIGRLFQQRRMVLVTGHRRENFGEGFRQICHAINNLSVKFPDVDFVYPIHLNPEVQKPVQEILGKDSNKNIFLLKPLDYLPFIFLMSKSFLVLTDSGGIQEEAPAIGKPVLVMRDTTERPEAVGSGTVKLVGTDRGKIEQEVTALLKDSNLYNSMAKAIHPYGDGKAAERIVDFFLNMKQ